MTILLIIAGIIWSGICVAAGAILMACVLCRDIDAVLDSHPFLPVERPR